MSDTDNSGALIYSSSYDSASEVWAAEISDATVSISSTTHTGFRLLGFALLIGCCLFLTKIADAAPLEPQLKRAIDRGPIMDPAIFKGVDTFAVTDSFGPDAPKLLNATHNDIGLAIIGTLQKIFGDANTRLPVSGISIKPVLGMDIKDLHKPNVVQLHFVLSARQEMIAGKPVNVAALDLALAKFDSNTAVAEGVTYPFVVPDSQEELEQRIRDGVFYLTSFLPSYHACANKHGRPTQECPDCNFSVCNVDRPYGEKP